MGSWAARMPDSRPSSALPPPLQGVTVVDLTRMLAGPYCAMILADLGATVIKVEPPEGDMIRRQGPYAPEDDLRAYGGYFQSVNRNKAGIAVDITTADGAEVVRRLVRSADILLENYRPGVMERHGLSYESLSAINPRLVYGAVRGFGDPRTGAGELQDWPSYDIVAQAMGGIMGITGPQGGPPTKVGPGVGDIVPALFAAIGVLAAVQDSRRTGHGRFVDVAMYDSILAVCERLVYQYSYTADVAVPESNGHPLLCPFDVFPARDGWIALAAPGDKHWRSLCEIMGRPALAEDPRFVTNVERVAHKDDVRAMVSDWTRTRDRAEISRLLGGRVPFGPVNTAPDIFADPHVHARRMLVDVEHPGLDRLVTIAGQPIKFAGLEEQPVRRAPLLGEDTDRVLAELGFSSDEVAAMRCAGTVR
jgi:crotonobetainyl-CoA:carnitine CoA-transferase CaiB-like acyl-CoA transferase